MYPIWILYEVVWIAYKCNFWVWGKHTWERRRPREEECIWEEKVQIRCSKQQEGIRTAAAPYSRTAVAAAFFLQQSHTSISAGYTLLCSVLFTVQLLSYSRFWRYLVSFDHWSDKLIWRGKSLCMCVIHLLLPLFIF